jgi:hypothetical protein
MRLLRTVLSALLGTALILGFGGASHVSAINALDTALSDPSAGFQNVAPAIARNPLTGESLVAWTAVGPRGKAEIHGRFLDASARPVGERFVVATVGDPDDPTTDAVDPAVVHHGPSGRFIVTYAADTRVDEGGSLIDFGIYAVSVGSDSSIGEATAVSAIHVDNPDTQINARRPAMAVNSSSGHIIVAWEDDEHSREGLVRSGRYEIHTRMLDVAADTSVVALGDEEVVSTTGDGSAPLDARSPAVAYHSRLNRFVVAWDSEFSGDTTTGIVARLVDGDGTPLGDDTEIGRPSGRDFHPSVVATATGFSIVWERDVDLAWSDLEIRGGVLQVGPGPSLVDLDISGGAARTPAATAVNGGTDVYAVWASATPEARIRSALLRDPGEGIAVSDHADHQGIAASVSRPSVVAGPVASAIVVWSGVEPALTSTAQIWVESVGLGSAAPIRLPATGSTGTGVAGALVLVVIGAIMSMRARAVKPQESSVP